MERGVEIAVSQFCVISPGHFQGLIGCNRAHWSMGGCREGGGTHAEGEERGEADSSHHSLSMSSRFGWNGSSRISFNDQVLEQLTWPALTCDSKVFRRLPLSGLAPDLT